MIAIDTNVLVYAHRADSPHHEKAAAAPADRDFRRFSELKVVDPLGAKT